MTLSDNPISDNSAASSLQTQEAYKILYESSADAIMTLEPPDWKFTSANPACVKMFGVANESAMLSLSPQALSPEYQPDGTLSSQKSLHMITIAMAEGSHLFEWVHQRFQGEQFPATVLLSRIEIGGKKFLQATVRDITEHKKIEEAVVESKAFLESITDAAKDSIVMMNNKGNITFWNKASETMFGYEKAEILGKNLHALIPAAPEHKAKKDNLERFFQTGESPVIDKTIELSVMRKNGEIFPVELSVSRVKIRDAWCAIGIMRDISKRKQDQEDMLKKQQELERMNALMVGRELKMTELKKENDALKAELAARQHTA